MTILVLYLSQNNHVILPVIAAGLCSLLLGIVFVLYLPILIEKNYHDHWGMCIAYSSVGSVYMLVEVLAMIGAVPSFFEDNKGLVAIGILTLSSLIFLLSNTYLQITKNKSKSNSSNLSRRAAIWRDTSSIHFLYNTVIYISLLVWNSIFRLYNT